MDNFLHYGADLQWLSAFPAEAEVRQVATDHCMVVVDGEEDAPMKCSISTEGEYWRRRPPQLYVRSSSVPIDEIYPAREESTRIKDLAVGTLPEPGLQVEVLKGELERLAVRRRGLLQPVGVAEGHHQGLVADLVGLQT